MPPRAGVLVAPLAAPYMKRVHRRGGNGRLEAENRRKRLLNARTIE